MQMNLTNLKNVAVTVRQTNLYINTTRFGVVDIQVLALPFLLVAYHVKQYEADQEK